MQEQSLGPVKGIFITYNYLSQYPRLMNSDHFFFFFFDSLYCVFAWDESKLDSSFPSFPLPLFRNNTILENMHNTIQVLIFHELFSR